MPAATPTAPVLLAVTPSMRMNAERLLSRDEISEAEGLARERERAMP